MGEWTVQRCPSSCLSRKIPLRVDAESLCKRLVSCQVVLNDTPVGQKMKPVQTSRQILHQFAIYPCGRRVPRCNTRPQPAHLGRYCWRLECFMSWTLTRTVIQADSPSSLLDDNDSIGHLPAATQICCLRESWVWMGSGNKEWKNH